MNEPNSINWVGLRQRLDDLRHRLEGQQAKEAAQTALPALRADLAELQQDIDAVLQRMAEATMPELRRAAVMLALALEVSQLSLMALERIAPCGT